MIESKVECNRRARSTQTLYSHFYETDSFTRTVDHRSQGNLCSKIGYPDDWVWKWLGQNYESPIKQLISTSNHEAIESSILLEFPAPHAGEHITMWFERTKSQAYYIELVEDNPPHKTKEALKTQEYDKFFDVTSRATSDASKVRKYS